MENEIKQKEGKFSDYMFILYKWKKFLLINLLIIGLLATAIAFLIPKEYRATATIMIPPKDQMGLGGISGLLGGKSSLLSAGSKLLGMSGTTEDMLLGIINSRTALTDVINKFDLMKYYDIDDNNMDKALKALKSDISANPNEFGMINFSIINKDPRASADIANYLVSLVDSMNIEFNIKRARSSREFIEKRYRQNVKDLKMAEDSLYSFQKKYGIVAVPEQLEVSVKAAAEIESELMKREMQAFIIAQQYGKNSPQYLTVESEVKLLKKKVEELKNSSKLSSTSNVLFSFKDMPTIAIQYLRNYREVEIQQSIMEIVMPMYEQAKVEEQNSVPTVMVVDKAVPPELKYSPKRAVIIIGLILLFAFMFIPMVFWGEKSINRKNFRNPLQKKEAKFFNGIIKIYRMKF